MAKLVPDFDEYRKPFIEGGSVFIYLKQKYPNKIFWINGLYYTLIISGHMHNKIQINLLNKSNNRKKLLRIVKNNLII